MRKTSLDQLAECKWELEESKKEIKQLQKVKQEYILYTQIIKVKFPRQHEGVLTELETSKKKLKEKTEEIRN
tara:strand:+ start:31 stop:246 length:216 start_codon:yes stop_codon:yes gene_type:complete